MATAQLIHDGNSIDYTPSSGGADVSAGDVIVQGDLIGIAKLDIAAGTLGALAVTGVFDLPKTAGVGEAIGAGAKVYWDEAESVAKTDDEAGANKYLGKTVLAAVDDDTSVRVRLEQ
jgi:predicted RecA/RadA family phage recombinase